jgi:hypothetical protein
MKQILTYLSLFLIVLLTTEAWGYTEHDCIRCHSHEGTEMRLSVNVNNFRSSVHGKIMGCLDCHQSIKDSNHIEIEDSKKTNCQTCHDQQNLHASDRSVTCDACHTHHYVFEVGDPRSSVNWKNLRHTCGKCHLEQSQHTNLLSVLSSIRIASHPKQNFGMIFDMGMCVGCHQGQAAHGENTPVNDQNCYRCHVPLAKNNFVLGYVHTNADWRRCSVNSFAGYIYLAVALALITLLVRGIVIFVKK